MIKHIVAGVCLGIVVAGSGGPPGWAQGPEPRAGAAPPGLSGNSSVRPKPVADRLKPTAIKARLGAGVNEVAIPLKARTLAIVLSGDGGWWGDLDRKLAEKLGEQGYAVIGLDTNTWFHKTRTPDEIAAEIGGLIKDYRARTGAREVALIGYSFGADVLPLAVNRLGPSTAKHIAAIVMIAPSRGVDPHVTLLEQTGVSRPTIDLAPEFTRLPVKKVLCVYGAEQAEESACTTPYLSIAKVVELPGGHHFDGVLEHLSQPVIATLAEWAPPK